MVNLLRQRLVSWLSQTVGALLLLMLTLAFLQVMLRYFFAASLLWVEEASVMALVWMAWAGAALLWLTHGHLAVHLLTGNRSVRLRPWLGRAVNGLAVVGGLALATLSWETITAFQGIRMGSLELPASIKYYPVAAGGIGLAFAAAIDLWADLKGLE